MCPKACLLGDLNDVKLTILTTTNKVQTSINSIPLRKALALHCTDCILLTQEKNGII